MLPASDWSTWQRSGGGGEDAEMEAAAATENARSLPMGERLEVEVDCDSGLVRAVHQADMNLKMPFAQEVLWYQSSDGNTEENHGQ
eukprot:1174049-Prorocentrum_minimum.AAC.1